MIRAMISLTMLGCLVITGCGEPEEAAGTHVTAEPAAICAVPGCGQPIGAPPPIRLLPDLTAEAGGCYGTMNITITNSGTAAAGASVASANFTIGGTPTYQPTFWVPALAPKQSFTTVVTAPSSSYYPASVVVDIYNKVVESVEANTFPSWCIP